MKKTSHWITLPDENSEKKSNFSFSTSMKASFFKLKNRLLNLFNSQGNVEKEKNKGDVIAEDRVENKAFWGIGFLILLVLTAFLLAPNQLANLFGGNLFDALDEIEIIPSDAGIQPLQIVPPEAGNFENAQGSETASVDEELSQEEETSTTESTNNNEGGGGVEAQTNPVEVQVDPISVDPEPIEDGAEEEGLNPAAPEEFEEEGEAEEGETNADLLQKLAKELEELKQKDLANQALIDSLSQSDEEGLNNAASDTAAENNDLLGSPAEQGTSEQEKNNTLDDLLNLNTNQNTITPPTQTNITSKGYRENMHKVTISPQQILADFNQRYNQALQESQNNANTSNQNSQLNGQLDNIPSTPSSGPVQGVLPAAMITLLILFGWKSARIFLRS